MVTVSVDGSVLDRIAKIMSYLRLGSSGKVLKKKKKEKDTKGIRFVQHIFMTNYTSFLNISFSSLILLSAKLSGCFPLLKGAIRYYKAFQCISMPDPLLPSVCVHGYVRLQHS